MMDLFILFLESEFSEFKKFSELRYETDFFYHTDNKSYFINVSDTVHSIETATRETRSLMNAQKQYPETKSFLVLNEWSNELIPDNIAVIPALRFLTANPAQF